MISLVMTNGDHEGQIFSIPDNPHANNGFVFLHIIKHGIFIFKKTLAEAAEYAGMRHIT